MIITRNDNKQIQTTDYKKNAFSSYITKTYQLEPKSLTKIKYFNSEN